MLKTLFKKQLMEIFRGYFYNSRKNQARSSGATAAYFLLFTCLIIGVIGGMFTILSFHCALLWRKSECRGSTLL